MLKRRRRLTRPKDTERRKGSLLLPHHAQGEKLRSGAPLSGRAQCHDTRPFSEEDTMRYCVSRSFHKLPGSRSFQTGMPTIYWNSLSKPVTQHLVNIEPVGRSRRAEGKICIPWDVGEKVHMSSSLTLREEDISVPVSSLPKKLSVGLGYFVVFIFGTLLLWYHV